MIGSQAVCDEAKTELGDQAKELTITVGGATPSINGQTTLLLVHDPKKDKLNTGKYIEVPVQDDQPLDDQVKAALKEAGLNVTYETASEKKAKADAETAKKTTAPAAHHA